MTGGGPSAVTRSLAVEPGQEFVKIHEFDDKGDGMPTELPAGGREQPANNEQGVSSQYVSDSGVVIDPFLCHSTKKSQTLTERHAHISAQIGYCNSWSGYVLRSMRNQEARQT
jgi:hypothetical protein